jgi:hypothetical protein
MAAKIVSKLSWALIIELIWKKPVSRHSRCIHAFVSIMSLCTVPLPGDSSKSLPRTTKKDYLSAVRTIAIPQCFLVDGKEEQFGKNTNK